MCNYFRLWRFFFYYFSFPNQKACTCFDIRNRASDRWLAGWRYLVASVTVVTNLIFSCNCDILLSLIVWNKKEKFAFHYPASNFYLLLLFYYKKTYLIISFGSACYRVVKVKKMREISYEIFLLINFTTVFSVLCILKNKMLVLFVWVSLRPNLFAFAFYCYYVLVI